MKNYAEAMDCDGSQEVQAVDTEVTVDEPEQVVNYKEAYLELKKETAGKLAEKERELLVAWKRVDDAEQQTYQAEQENKTRTYNDEHCHPRSFKET